MPQTPSEYFGNVKGTVQSFWHGLSVTLSHMLRRPITTQYPDRTPAPVRETLPPRYRGFLEVDVDICTGCQACERACPIGCIQINLEKDPANPKQRLVTQFDIDEAKCMFCGLCVEPCPTGSIQHSREFEAACRSVRNLVFRWADPASPFPVYKVDKNATYYPRAPLGSLVRKKLESRAWDAPGPKFLPPEAPKPAAPKAAKAEGAAAAKAAAPAAAAAAAPAAKPAAAASANPAAKPSSVPAAPALDPAKVGAKPPASPTEGAPPAAPSAPPLHSVAAGASVAPSPSAAPNQAGTPAAASEAPAPAAAGASKP
jgi:NADH-quinone oxidoreductase subunit I/NAD(P)H-quinone oxidoreductase subunit I